MVSAPQLALELSSIPQVRVLRDELLSELTRFGIGGPAALYVETPSESSFIEVLRRLRASGSRWVVIGGGTNLIVSDHGFDETVVRLTAREIRVEGNLVHAAAGAVLQDLVDFTIDQGLAGVHTMTGIPGSVGAAVYGNAGAYGRSLAQSVLAVRFFDGSSVRTLDNAGCGFRYRESVFKRNKDWIIFGVTLELERGDGAALRAKATEILDIRNRKYPPTMKCAGSIFKNLLFDELPESVQEQVPARVIIEGKVPSAFFLEQVGAKGMKNGDIHVADYHANLIYNAGRGTAEELVEVIRELKARVRERFGFDLCEEVQYVGFE